MEQYKEDVYKKYYSVHNQNLYGDLSLNKIRKSFNTWDHYYGFALPEDRKSQILDIGCGAGEMVYYLQEKGYKSAVGIDVSEEQIEVGEKLGIEGLVKADLREFLKDKNGTFNLIIAKDVLEHFSREEAYEVCKLVYSALKVSGKFLIQVPNGEGLFYTSIFYGDITHEWAYTESSLSQLLKTVGFASVIAREIEPYKHGLASWIRWMAWKIIRGWHRIKKAVVTGSSKGIFSPNIICLAKKE